ncbi:hypothetical protein FH972_023277 [Carpinus fangiana]|uniref:Uncharacterized protein n=1 Tax=Carpinus fangiana TaxID=176857 RepID=A0A5N6KV76_9ROSI|nr:hypothetical protein FH972_023277 [Carpinus fangiana]
MSFQPIGDTAVLVKVAYELYNKGRQIRDAPEDFHDLLSELFTIRNVLWRLHQESAAGAGDPLRTMEHCRVQCTEALQTFKPIVVKYQRLAFSQRGLWLRRVQFVTDRNHIKRCREKLNRCKQDLMLALAVDTRSSVSGAAQQQRHSPNPTAIPEVESPRPQREGSITVLNPRLLTAPNPEDSLPILQRLQRVETLDSNHEGPSPSAVLQPAHTLVNRVRTRSSLDTPEQLDLLRNVTPPFAPRAHRISQDDDSAIGLLPNLPTTPVVPPRSNARPRPHGRLSIPAPDPISDGTPSPLSGPSDSSIRSRHDAESATTYSDYWYLGDVEREYERKNERTISLSESQIASIESRLELDHNFPELQAHLWKHVQALRAQDLSSILLQAVWWNLKSRKCHTTLSAQPSEVPQGRQSWHIEISKEQAFVDLLKSRALVVFAITKDHPNKPSFTEPQWKILQDLASAIRDEFGNQAGKNSNWNEKHLLRKHLDLKEERIQPVEESSAMPNGLDDLDSPVRWITVDKDDGGRGQQEKVILRTFVNAQIGDKSIRRKSSAAPYMLVVWSQTGRSEIKVSIINQAGTVNLCRSMTAEDLEYHDDHARFCEFDLNFPSQDTAIRFNSPEELEDFLARMRRFFKEMEQRDPLQGEFLVFRESVEAFESHAVAAIRQAGNGSSNKPSGKIHTACEISLFEKITNESWKTVRRLVISSPPDTSTPWCISFWLPLCVQVHVEDRDLELAWSDCSHLQKTDDGNFNPRWSYVFGDTPNNVMNLTFESRAVADEASKYLLQPFETPFKIPYFEYQCGFASGVAPDNGQETHVFKLTDMDDTQEYFAILAVEKRPHARTISSAYFLYRDLDIVFESSPGSSEADFVPRRVRFPELSAAHYISTITDLPYLPKDDTPAAEFKDVVEVTKDASFAFKDKQDIARFIAALIGWELVHCCVADEFTLGGRVSSKKQHNVVIGLWSRIVPGQSAAELRLTARASNGHSASSPRWTTVSIADAEDCVPNYSSTKLVIKGVDVQQGDLIDGSTLEAVERRTGKPHVRREGRLTIHFKNRHSVRDFDNGLSALLRSKTGDWDGFGVARPGGMNALGLARMGTSTTSGSSEALEMTRYGSHM